MDPDTPSFCPWCAVKSVHHLTPKEKMIKKKEEKEEEHPRGRDRETNS
jgi:hypothetical protein